MSVPSSMRVGPFTPNILARKRYIIPYVILMWLTIIPIVLEFWLYWRWLYHWKPIHFYLFLPSLGFLMYLTMVFTAIIFAKLFLVIINLFNKPKEGVFLRDPSDRDFRYWSLRNTIKKWPTWLSHRFPFPFLDNLCFKAFGVKTTFKNSLFEGWVDTEFIEFGKNVVVGQGSHIQSSCVVGNLIIVRKTVIEDNVRIGAHAFVMPGTYIEKNAVLAANSATIVGQRLEEGWIYVGVPAKKFKRNVFFEDGLQNVLGQVENVEKLRQKYEELYIKRYDEHLTIRERIRRVKERKIEEQRRKALGI